MDCKKENHLPCHKDEEKNCCEEKCNTECEKNDDKCDKKPERPCRPCGRPF